MGYVIGADIGGTRIKTGLVELHSNRIMGVRVIPTAGENEEMLLNCLQKEIQELTEDSGISRNELSGIGISIGSYIFPESGIVDSMCGFMGISDRYPLKEVLEKRLDLPCKIENDARLIGYAESMFGAAKGYERALTLTLGTGVGVGFVVNQEFPDKDACIHLSGHIKVREFGKESALDSERCYCSVEGCLESTCSGTALQKMGRQIFGGDITNAELFQMAGDGERKALKLIEKYLDYLAIGLNQYIYVFAPDVIVLGGGVSKGLKPYLSYIGSRVKASIRSGYTTEIKLSELNENSGILGAASLFFERSQWKNENYKPR